MEPGVVVNIILSILSFLLALISIVTVIITINQNKKLLEANEQQINEMREEHRLSVQPIIVLEKGKFSVERPRFYYTPPKNSYEFVSRYHYQVSLKNVSSATAICVDISAKLLLQKEGRKMEFGAVTERENVLPFDKESEAISILFAGDSECYLYEALRDNNVDKLPKIDVEIVYKNTCGGYFLCRQTFILAPQKDDYDTIRTWHTAMTGASVEAKEAIDLMKKATHGKQWDLAFETMRKAFDVQLGTIDKAEVSIELVEIPEMYSFQVLDQDEYRSITKEYQYPHFIHNGVPRCTNMKENTL